MKKLLCLIAFFSIASPLISGSRNYNKAIDPDKLTRAVPEATINEDDNYFDLGLSRSIFLSPTRRSSTESSTKALRNSIPSKYSGHNLR